jgi:hypothetical protein
MAKSMNAELAWNAVADAESREPTADFPLRRAADEPSACDATGLALGAATRLRLDENGGELARLRDELQRAEAARTAAAPGQHRSICSAVALAAAASAEPPSGAARSPPAPPFSASRIVASAAHRTMASNREEMERKAEALRHAMARAAQGNGDDS